MFVIAHRGASGHQPENTLLAFKTALAMDVAAIELDVHVVDGQLMVLHDRWLHKTTSGTGRVADSCINTLSQLDAGQGQRVPSLLEVLALVNGRCDINIELKSEQSVSLLIDIMLLAINKYHFSVQQFLISSFNHHLLQQVKQRWPEIYIAPLIAGCPIEYARFAEDLQAYSVNVDVDFVNQAFINDAHQRGIKVFVYTVDEFLDIQEMQALGVDAVFTNYPERTINYIRSNQLSLMVS